MAEAQGVLRPQETFSAETESHSFSAAGGHPVGLRSRLPAFGSQQSPGLTLRWALCPGAAEQSIGANTRPCTALPHEPLYCCPEVQACTEAHTDPPKWRALADPLWGWTQCCIRHSSLVCSTLHQAQPTSQPQPLLSALAASLLTLSPSLTCITQGLVCGLRAVQGLALVSTGCPGRSLTAGCRSTACGWNGLPILA